MQIDSLDDLYIDQLADIYDAEKRLVKALPKMAKKASSPELRSAFEDHVQKTRHHVERLEEIFQELGRDATGKKCKAMMGLLSEGKDILDKDIDPISGMRASWPRPRRWSITRSPPTGRFARWRRPAAIGARHSCCKRHWKRKRRPTRS